MILAALAFAPACIIPIGPEWRDPLAADNVAPRIVDSQPQIGSVHVPPATSGPTTFRIRVTDDNVGDTLYVRFLADYPPFDGEITRVLEPVTIEPRSDGAPVDQEVPVHVPPCGENNLARGLPTHQIYVVVADRPFVGPVDRPEQIEDGGESEVGFWTLDLDCP